MAEMELQRALLILDQAKVNDAVSFSLISTEIALVLAAQQKHTQAERTLEAVVERLSQDRGDGEGYWRARCNLMAEYMVSDVAKAVKTGERMLEDGDISEQRKGEAWFLYGDTNYARATGLLGTENRFFPSEIRPYLLHNLACAEWWEMFSFEPFPSIRNGTKPSAEAISLPVSHLKAAISLFETRPEDSQLVPGDDLTLTSGHVSKSLTALASLYLSAQTTEEASKWLKCSLRYHQTHEEREIGQTLVLLAGILKREKNVLHAEGMMKYAIDLLNGVRTIQRGDFQEVFALREYADLLETMPKREHERTEVVAKAKMIEDRLPSWTGKTAYLHIPQLQSL